MESTPSDFDESTSARFRVMTEKELLQEYISLLNKMSLEVKNLYMNYIYETRCVAEFDFELLRIIHFFIDEVRKR